MSDVKYNKWVSCWGNATSITDRKEAVYSKNITLRYPVKMCFSGSKLRFRFSNLTGTEPVEITKAYVSESITGKCINTLKSKSITFDGNKVVIIQPGKEIVSDEIIFEVKSGDDIAVSIYLGDYTQMNAGVLITGPLSKGYYSYGDFCDAEELPLKFTRNTNWFYFLNTIDVFTEDKNKAFICYGDSITAQSWPDYLSLRLKRENINNVSVIRRAVSGTRILREYDSITYAAYGIKGETRFPIEINSVSGAKAVLIQHGINDIIHPVGVDINPFRPWSDMPELEDLKNGMRMYKKMADEKELKVYTGTLLPIYGWRTYADFREKLRCDFNSWLLDNDDFDGCVDFDKAVCDPCKKEAFLDGFDSGDHLHPSESAYKKMAEVIPEYMF